RSARWTSLIGSARARPEIGHRRQALSSFLSVKNEAQAPAAALESPPSAATSVPYAQNSGDHGESSDGRPATTSSSQERRPPAERERAEAAARVFDASDDRGAVVAHEQTAATELPRLGGGK